MSPLLSLAARVESASGADRELDAEIHQAIGNCLHEMEVLRVEVEPGEFDLVPQCRKCGSFTEYAPKHFTRSLDAAMSLVPAGGFGSIVAGMVAGSADKRAYVAVVTKPSRAEGVAATPALALTAASLRALAARN